MQFTWNYPLTGPAYTAVPTMRIYIARVATAGGEATASAAEWLEEVHAAWWRPMQLSWHANARPSTLTLRRVLGQGPGKPARDRVEDVGLLAGDRVRLVEACAGGPGGTEQREWFRGVVAQDRLLVDAEEGESHQVTAYGPELLLAGKVVSGQWHAVPEVDANIIAGLAGGEELTAANSFRGHLPVVFNEDGEPNACAATADGEPAFWRLDARGEAPAAKARTFDAPGRRVVDGEWVYAATHWTAGAAVQSLVEAVDGYEVISPRSLASLPADLHDAPLSEVDVEGLDLPAALRRVLHAAGWGYAIEPWAGRDGRHDLRVFRLRGQADGERVRRPCMAPLVEGGLSVTDADAQRAEVQRIELVRDSHNVRNDVAVIGDRRRRQVALAFAAAGGELNPAWDTRAHDLADWAGDDGVDPMQWPCDAGGLLSVGLFDANYTYGSAANPDFRHVFRGFTWNEDGAFNAVGCPPGDIAAAGLDVEGNFLRRPRPVGSTFLRDDADTGARHLPAFVQLGIDGDDASWVQAPAVLWRDRAGFTIPINPLWAWYPYADAYARHVGGSETLFDRYGHLSYLTLLHNALRGEGVGLVLRLVGSVESDQPVIGRAERRISSSWPFAARKAVRAEHRFVARDVAAGGDPLDLAADRHDTRDDTASATAFAAAVRDAMEDELVHGSIILRHVSRSYAPGDVVSGTDGRAIDLTVRSGEWRYAPVIAGVVWNFQHGANKTELLLDSSLLKVSQ
jgi:hypothetical protein